MKVIFLDFDGVLNTDTFIDEQKLCGALSNSIASFMYRRAEELDPKALARLFQIVHATDAKIVLVTTWKEWHSIADISTMMIEAGYLGVPPIIDATHRFDNKKLRQVNRPILSRGEQVDQWLNETTESIEGYLIIDDSVDYSAYQKHKHMIMTDADLGLEEKHIKEAIEILSQPL